MPAKITNKQSGSLIVLSSTLVIISSVFILSNSTPPKNITYAATPTVTLTPDPIDTTGLFINYSELSVGLKYNKLILREIKPVTGTKLDLNSNIAVTFQGQTELSGKFNGECFQVDPDQVISILPRFPKASNQVLICFTAKPKLTTANKITIDNYTIEKLWPTYSYHATLIK